MDTPENCVILYCTTETRGEALIISRALIAERLAACANILGAVTSVYEWEGKLQEVEEFSFIIKTSEGKRDAAIARISALHSYECPCILPLRSEGGYRPFLSWIGQQTGRSGDL
jgi:periplasmic divalent cation tolerance protein